MPNKTQEKEGFLAKVKENPVKTILTTAAVIGALFTILGFGSKMITAVDSVLVTHKDLSAMETRITERFEKEAVTIRTTYIEDLTSQISKLNTLLGSADTIGEVELYKLQIQTLNKRIERLQGDH